MLGVGVRRGVVPTSSILMGFAVLAVALLAPGEAETAGTSKEAMRPVISADAPGRLRAGPGAQEEGGRHGGRQRHAAAIPRRSAASGLARAPSCLPDALKAALLQIEQRWGPVTIISAHRPGAKIRGSGRASLHASCRAVDFRPPKGTYRAVAGWLKKNLAGGVGTYSGKHNHIHIDARPCRPGRCYRWHN